MNQQTQQTTLDQAAANLANAIPTTPAPAEKRKVPWGTVAIVAGTAVAAAGGGYALGRYRAGREVNDLKAQVQALQSQQQG